LCVRRTPTATPDSGHETRATRVSSAVRTALKPQAQPNRTGSETCPGTPRRARRAASALTGSAQRSRPPRPVVSRAARAARARACLSVSVSPVSENTHKNVYTHEERLRIAPRSTPAAPVARREITDSPTDRHAHVCQCPGLARHSETRAPSSAISLTCPAALLATPRSRARAEPCRRRGPCRPACAPPPCRACAGSPRAQGAACPCHRSPWCSA
jgi:hypothetical protein